MMIDRYRYIVIEGPIGTGKTTLARKLAEHFNLHPVLEDVEGNPFLVRFYRDRERYALPAQLSFLLARLRQMEALQADLGKTPIVADFFLAKDPLFARVNLSGDELDLYSQMYQRLAAQMPWPDLVIYLQAPPPILLERVQRRGRSFEVGIQESYLEKVAIAYSEFFHHYDASPLLVVNNVHLNIVDQPADFETLVNVLRDHRGGREFFNMGG